MSLSVSVCASVCVGGLRENLALFCQPGHSSAVSRGLSVPVEGHYLNVIRPELT